MTVAELGASMSSREYADWKAFYLLENQKIIEAQKHGLKPIRRRRGS